MPGIESPDDACSGGRTRLGPGREAASPNRRAQPSARSVASVVLGVAALLSLAACGSGSSAATDRAGSGAVAVVTTTTVFADIVRNVGGDLVDVTSLVPKGGDVHTFEPKPADIKTVASARLLVMNGLGLDDWLQKTITNVSAGGTPLLKLAVDLPGVELLPGEDPGTQNPHLWMDVKYGELYVDRIADTLKSIDPTHGPQYDSQASAYKARLDALDASVRSRIATIPAGEAQARHVPRRVPVLRSRLRRHDRRGRRPGPRPGSERWIHGPAHHRHPRSRSQGDLQRGPVPDQARRPARDRDRSHRRVEPVRRFAW